MFNLENKSLVIALSLGKIPKPRLGRKNVKQVCYVGAEALQRIDAARKKHDAALVSASEGLFLSADPHIQSPLNSQSLNRYSYTLNNPLSWTDPSGYFLTFPPDHYHDLDEIKTF